MNIACFHIESWQEPILKKNLANHNLKIFGESLRQDNIKEAEDADIIVSRARFLHLEFNKETLNKLPNLKLIATMSTYG